MKLNSCHEQNVANGQNCFKLNHSLIQLIPHLFCYFHFLIRSKNIIVINYFFTSNSISSNIIGD